MGQIKVTESMYKASRASINFNLKSNIIVTVNPPQKQNHSLK